MSRAQWRHDDTGESARQFHLNVRRFALNRTGRGGRRQNSIRADHLRREGPFHVRVVGLLGLAPSQAPQSAHREDDGEERGHAEREECPDEEETPAAGGPEADSCPSHVRVKTEALV